MRHLAILTCSLLLCAGHLAFGNDRPNLLLILADDLGYGDLGSYGQQLIRTPRLDRMAAEGMRFTQHYAGAPSCHPSRCVLFTGKHTGHARIRANSKLPLLPEDFTLSQMLHQAGYATGGRAAGNRPETGSVDGRFACRFAGFPAGEEEQEGQVVPGSRGDGAHSPDRQSKTGPT